MSLHACAGVLVPSYTLLAFTQPWYPSTIPYQKQSAQACRGSTLFQTVPCPANVTTTHLDVQAQFEDVDNVSGSRVDNIQEMSGVTPDIQPVHGSSISDLDLESFTRGLDCVSDQEVYSSFHSKRHMPPGLSSQVTPAGSGTNPAQQGGAGPAEPSRFAASYGSGLQVRVDC